MNYTSIAIALDANLLAEADETWMHPSGAFVLAPSYGIQRRSRILPNGKVVGEDRACRACGTRFVPERKYARYCSPDCAAGARKRHQMQGGLSEQVMVEHGTVVVDRNRTRDVAPMVGTR